MADNTSKLKSNLDSGSVLQFAFNENERSISVGSFITAKIGHKIEQVAVNSTTDDFHYYDSSTLVLTLRIIYTDSTKETLSSVERIA